MHIICAGSSAHLLSCFQLFATPWTVKPVRLLCPLDFPGKNIEGGCYFPLRESSQLIHRTQVSCNPGRLFTTEPPGKPHKGWNKQTSSQIHQALLLSAKAMILYSFTFLHAINLSLFNISVIWKNFLSMYLLYLALQEKKTEVKVFFTTIYFMTQL